MTVGPRMLVERHTHSAGQVLSGSEAEPYLLRKIGPRQPAADAHGSLLVVLVVKELREKEMHRVRIPLLSNGVSTHVARELVV
jgi:hypothetical protein